MISQLIKSVIRELLTFRIAVVIGFAIVSLSILTVGWVWPKTYSSHSMIFADNTNIIKPLLEGSAQTTKITDHSRVVREVIQSRRLMTQIAEKTGLVNANMAPEQQEKIIKELSTQVEISGVGQSYTKISYKAPEADLAFRVASTVTELFLADSAETKQRESREAYTFIDKQVSTYKSQLLEAEEALKQFNASNFDGTEDTVNNRINSLRAQIEDIKLAIEGYEARKESIESEVEKESKYTKVEYRASVYQQQVQSLESKLATLRLSFTDTHPDIVGIKLQIEDLKKLAAQENTNAGSDPIGSDINPLYKELRSKLAEVNLQIRTNYSQLSSTEKLLEEEFERRKRIANRKAELAELTRDYDVTKEIYEDMLSRKEKARLSMTLDIEGQGVSYKVQEPADYPLVPTGIRFIHFFFAGPIIALLLPIGIIFLYLQVDPRIRYVDQLKEDLSIPVVAVIPHVSTPLTSRAIRRDIMALAAIVILVGAAYATVALIKLEIL